MALNNQLANSIRGTLTAGINDAVTAMNVTLAAGSASYPADIDADNPIYLTIADADNVLLNEIVKVTAVTGANVTTMVRGQRGTIAQAWSAGDAVTLNLHAHDITEIRDFVKDVIDDDGNVTAADLDVTGVATLAAGTEAAPGATLGDAATGVYRPALNEIAISINGTKRLHLTASGLAITGGLSVSGVTSLAAGTVAAPGLHLGDTGTGVYRPAENEVGVTVSGTKRVGITSTGVAITGTLTASGVITAPAGSAAANALNFGTAGTGLHGDATSVYVATAGVDRAVFSSAGLAITGGTLGTTNSGGSANLTATCYRDSATLAGVQGLAARGTSSAPASLNSGDNILAISARPWQTGTTFGASATIQAYTTEAHSATANGTAWRFFVCANGGTTQALALTIGQDRAITIPGSFAHTGSTFGVLNTTPATKQTVSGSRGSNAALASLITALATYGLVTDSTT